MQKSYECHLATPIGPESCGAAREGGVEALTGERAGRVLRREIRSSGSVEGVVRDHDSYSDLEFPTVILAGSRDVRTLPICRDVLEVVAVSRRELAECMPGAGKVNKSDRSGYALPLLS